jgi:U3 small nucleolar RNA-associated protein 25
MLYTGRAHFFLRHKIKGAKHLIMFGLPEYPEFYPELLNMLSAEDQGDEEDALGTPLSCLSLYSKYDAQCLERIVGTKHSERMIKGEKRTFLFHS